MFMTTANPNLAFPTSVPTEEQALVARCKEGDREAWDKLILKYERAVYKLAYSLGCHHEEAGDLTALVFLRLHQSLHTFRHESSFESWLFRIVRNLFLDMRICPANRVHLSLDGSSGIEHEGMATRDIRDPSATPEQICMQKEVAQLLTRAIMRLPAYQRQVLRMYHIDGKSYEEIVEETGLSIGTVKSRLNRARSTLRERLAPYEEILTNTG